MKINDIKVGTVYWYETGRDWGNWLTVSYGRSPVVRVDDKRYARQGTSWNPRYSEDPKGPYAAFRKVKEDGTTDPDFEPADRIHYIQSAHIRATMAFVRDRYDKRHEADLKAEETRKVKATEAAQRAADFRARIKALGLSETIKVGATNGQGWREGPPRVAIDFARTDSGQPLEARLVDLLDRLERGAAAERELAERRNTDPAYLEGLASRSMD